MSDKPKTNSDMTKIKWNLHIPSGWALGTLPQGSLYHRPPSCPWTDSCHYYGGLYQARCHQAVSVGMPLAGCRGCGWDPPEDLVLGCRAISRPGDEPPPSAGCLGAESIVVPPTGPDPVPCHGPASWPSPAHLCPHALTRPPMSFLSVMPR